MIKGILISLMFLSSIAVAAPKTADKMTCAQAVKHYETHKRIYVIANGSDVVPIYGMKPASKWRELSCGGRSNLWHYTVITKDDRRCPIAVYCR